MATKPSDSTKKKRARFPSLNSAQRDLLMFPVLERFMKRDEKTKKHEEATKIAAAISDQFKIRISRESVYRLVRDAVQHGYLRLFPPIHRLLSDELRACPNPLQGRNEV